MILGLVQDSMLMQLNNLMPNMTICALMLLKVRGSWFNSLMHYLYGTYDYIESFIIESYPKNCLLFSRMSSLSERTTCVPSLVIVPNKGENAHYQWSALAHMCNLINSSNPVYNNDPNENGALWTFCYDRSRSDVPTGQSCLGPVSTFDDPQASSFC